MENEKPVIRRSDLALPSDVIGRLMPQAPDLEEVVLGALLLDKDAIMLVEPILKADQLYSFVNQEIYNAILALYFTHVPVDLLTVTEQLKKEGKLDEIGGPYVLVGLTKRVASAANVEHHVRILLQKWILRTIISVGGKFTEAAYDGRTDAIELLATMQNALLTVDNTLQIGKSTDIEEVFRSVSAQILLRDKSEVFLGFTVGIDTMDTMIRGIREGEYLLIGGRPGSGKTTLALQMALHMAITLNKPIAFFTYEMPIKQLVKKLFSVFTGISSDDLESRVLNETERGEVVVATKLFLERRHNFNFVAEYMDGNGIRSRILSLQKERGIEMAFIDYFQLIPDAAGGNNLSTNDRKGATSNLLNRVAKETLMPIVALSQLTKEVESQPYCRPIMKNLRDTGSLEQDADRIWFVWRPDYHGITNLQWGQHTNFSTVGKVCILQEKSRHTGQGTIWLRFEGDKSKFSDLSSEDVNLENEIPTKIFWTQVEADNNGEDDTPF